MSKEELQELFKGYRRDVYVEDNKVIILHEEVPQIVYEYCATVELCGVEVLFWWEEQAKAYLIGCITSKSNN